MRFFDSGLSGGCGLGVESTCVVSCVCVCVYAFCGYNAIMLVTSKTPLGGEFDQNSAAEFKK